jgi:asparagine synthase (glutamine-hydrolysing)
MFALALWDRHQRALVLARDRMGEKPLYYGRVGRSFVFASELKAFRGYPGWNAAVDRDALTLLLRHNYVPAPYSIYEGFRKLRPGHFLTVTGPDNEPRIETYWTAHEAREKARLSPFKGSRYDAVVELEALLTQSTRGAMISDVPLGAFLSGGVDSSTVVALMQSISNRPIQTFTIGFHQGGYNEADHASKIAQHLGTKHTELYISERDALNVVPRLPEIYCEPFSDSSQLPTYLVSKLARQSVTVCLSGDGGDELFSAFADATWKKLARIPRSLRRAAAALAGIPSPTSYDRLASPLMGLLPKHRRFGRVGDNIHKAARLLSLRSANDVYHHLCSHWIEPSKIVVGGREPPTIFTGLDTLPDLASDVERMMHIDLVSYLPDDILVKLDRAAMAASLETRVPLLDHRIVEFCMSLPLEVLRAEKTAKWPLKQVLSKYVPKQLVERPKMGFGVPIDSWLRGALREWAEDLLSENRLKSDTFFEVEPIRRAWQEHLSGRRNHQYLLWDILMFQAWHKGEDSSRPELVAA